MGKLGLRARGCLACLAVLLAVKTAGSAPLPRDLSHDVPSVRRPRAVDIDAPSRKTETSGLGLSAGLGSQYAFLGIQAAYYLQLPRSLVRVAPYGGVGLFCMEDDCTPGWMFGAMGSWGKKHRLLVDAFYGTVTAYALRVHGEPAITKPYTGTGLAVGYEYMAFGGFFLRGSTGAAYAFGPPIKAPLHRIHWMLTPLGIGYKFW